MPRTCVYCVQSTVESNAMQSACSKEARVCDINSSIIKSAGIAEALYTWAQLGPGGAAAWWLGWSHTPTLPTHNPQGLDAPRTESSHSLQDSAVCYAECADQLGTIAVMLQQSIQNEEQHK